MSGGGRGGGGSKTTTHLLRRWGAFGIFVRGRRDRPTLIFEITRAYTLRVKGVVGGWGGGVYAKYELKGWGEMIFSKGAELREGVHR